MPNAKETASSEESMAIIPLGSASNNPEALEEWLSNLPLGEDPFAQAEWVNVVTDDGETINLEAEGTFVGIYIGSRIVSVENDRSGEMEDVLMLRFLDRSGARRWLWANYKLTEAFGEHGDKVSPGTVVRMRHHGKKDIGGGQTLNRMSVDIAR